MPLSASNEGEGIGDEDGDEDEEGCPGRPDRGLEGLVTELGLLAVFDVVLEVGEEAVQQMESESERVPMPAATPLPPPRTLSRLRRCRALGPNSP